MSFIELEYKICIQAIRMCLSSIEVSRRTLIHSWPPTDANSYPQPHCWMAHCGTKHACSNTRKLTDRVAIAAGMVKKLDEVVAGDDAGGDDISEGGHLGRRWSARGRRPSESKK